jgi:hypothetical protein
MVNPHGLHPAAVCSPAGQGHPAMGAGGVCGFMYPRGGSATMTRAPDGEGESNVCRTRIGEKECAFCRSGYPMRLVYVPGRLFQCAGLQQINAEGGV